MRHRFLPVLLTFSVVASSALAQGPEPSGPGIADAASHSFGVTTGADGVHAGGPDYTARFDRDGFEFVPLLGRRAESAKPVRYTLQSVRRGATNVLSVTGASPVVDGNRVRFEHAGGLVERYDARRDGIEQSFVFSTKPRGDGDLVVCGTIATELVVTAASDDGITFGAGDLEVVMFGAVTGVDANGVTVRGSIRVVDERIEWVLPASFVENAAYPLVLDPFVGNAFTVGNAAGIDVLPAVSYDATIDRYLVVWTVNVSSTQAEVRGQFVGGNGSIAGGLVLFDNDTPTDVRPSVANVNATDRFLVAYLANDPFSLGGQTSIIQQIYVRSVSAATGAMSSPVLAVAGGPFGGPGSFALGGDSRIGLFGSNQDALLVFEFGFIGTQDVDTMIVRVPSTGDPTFGTTQSLASSSFPAGDVAVSAHAGSLGRWLVAFGQNPSTLGAPFDRIVGQAIDGAGNLCGPLLTIVNGGPGADLRHPTVATRDGSEFVIAWENANAAAVNLRRFVHLGTCASGAWTGGAVIAPIVQSGNAEAPALAFAKDKYLLAWSQTVGTSSVAKVYCKGLDPATCADCGRELRTDTTILADVSPAIATHWQGGDQVSDEGLLVWSNSTIRGRRVEARSDDVVAGMGGGCVNGFDDFASYSGDAVLGNASFQLSIANSVSLPLVLIVGFSAISAPCGGCTIVPSPDILFPATNPYTLAIPCDPTLVGADLYTQWLVLKPSTCPILPDFSFTNTLRFTIGE